MSEAHLIPFKKDVEYLKNYQKEYAEKNKERDSNNIKQITGLTTEQLN